MNAQSLADCIRDELAHRPAAERAVILDALLSLIIDQRDEAEEEHLFPSPFMRGLMEQRAINASAEAKAFCARQGV